VWDGVTAPQFGREVFLQAGFDSVLVDAPCSSSGTWRRNPDARLRIASRESRESLYALQRQLLANAARQVRRGGRLVYGTCSWCVEENEDVFTSVLKTLQAVSPTESTMKLVGAPFVNSDTMFAAATRFLDE
jgi:16S rRNA (cytosine967-C5)-methyltransferase